MVLYFKTTCYMKSFPLKMNKWNSIICVLLHNDAQVPYLEI